MKQTHKVPTHVNVPDKIVLGLTARQFLIMLIGFSAGYDIWIQLHGLHADGVLGLIVRLFFSLIPAGISLGMALITVGGRPLEVWLLVLVRYARLPKTYVWRSMRTQPIGDQDSAGEGPGGEDRQQEDLESE